MAVKMERERERERERQTERERERQRERDRERERVTDLSNIEIILGVCVRDERGMSVVELLGDVRDATRIQRPLQLSNCRSATASLPPAMHQVMHLVHSVSTDLPM